MTEGDSIIQIKKTKKSISGKSSQKMKWSDEMLTEERLQGIERIVKEKGSASIPELMERMGISESTARRDLTLLDKQGRLQKVRGGAMIISDVYSTKEDTVLQKKDRNLEDHGQRKKYAASLIEPNDYLTEKDITFVTNAVSHARKLSMAGYTTYILGGEFKATTEAIVGDEAIESLQKYNFTKGFWGTNGVHQKLGFSTPDVKEAKVKEVAMKHCAKRYVLCDSSKFSQISCVKFGEFAKTCIITTQILDESYRQCDNIIEVK